MKVLSIKEKAKIIFPYNLLFYSKNLKINHQHPVRIKNQRRFLNFSQKKNHNNHKFSNNFHPQKLKNNKQIKYQRMIIRHPIHEKHKNLITVKFHQ